MVSAGPCCGPRRKSDVPHQVKIADPSQQMMTVKIMSESQGRHDDFLGVVVVPVSRIMSGESPAYKR